LILQIIPRTTDEQRNGTPKKKDGGMNSFSTTMHRRQDDKEYHVTSIQQCDALSHQPFHHKQEEPAFTNAEDSGAD
jgi:hypothetical protein